MHETTRSYVLQRMAYSSGQVLYARYNRQTFLSTRHFPRRDRPRRSTRRRVPNFTLNFGRKVHKISLDREAKLLLVMSSIRKS